MVQRQSVGIKAKPQLVIQEFRTLRRIFVVNLVLVVAHFHPSWVPFHLNLRRMSKICSSPSKVKIVSLILDSTKDILKLTR